MDCEQYTVILKHEIVSDGEKIEVEPPLVLTQTHMFDRRITGTSILINEMMDRFKEEILRRMER